MRSPILDYLNEVLDDCRSLDGGEVSPANSVLTESDPDVLSVAMVTVDGTVYAAGDVDVEFSIQSISKALGYGLALMDRGLETVKSKIDVEPSGDAFNEISLEADTGRPRNAMINAGALTAHSLIDGKDADERFRRVRDLHAAFVGHDLTMNEAVYDAELAASHRNRAIAHMLASVDVLDCEPAEVVDGYSRQCSIDVTTTDLAHLAATLANGGVHPESQDRVAPVGVVRQVLSTMTTCGMYDGTGDWIATVGIPAKSGISGAIIGVLPGQLGLAVHSPRLNEHGNSVRGIEIFERLSRDMELHMMDIAPSGRSVIRSTHTDDDASTYELQGDIRFAGAETVVGRLRGDELAADVTLDLRAVRGMDSAARRLLAEIVECMLDDDHRVSINDPHDLVTEGLDERASVTRDER